MIITKTLTDGFYRKLVSEEKSRATAEKYVRDTKVFSAFVHGGELTKETVIAYKKHLQKKYAPRSVNSMLASLNSFLSL